MSAMRQWNKAEIRCLSVIETLNDEHGWTLERAAQIRYVLSLRLYIDSLLPDGQLRAVVRNYHTEHMMVEALQQREHPQHHVAWSRWMRDVISVLHATRLQWSSDGAISDEDLAQVALMAVAHSIGSYRYRSRLSTWIYRVIVLSVRRYLREQQAAKRAGHPLSLQQFPVLDVPIALAQHPEVQARARLLVSQCMQILAAHPDKRLAAIFYLWAAEEQQLAEIGALYQLHPSRVGALLREIRSLLQHHPALQTWRSTE